MFFIFLIFIIFFVLKSSFFSKDFNVNYMDKNNTTIVNGLFIFLVFFSHLFSYISDVSFLDGFLYKCIGLVGQLMVTSFLFFSGYGIYYNIKNKEKYIDNFFKNRFIKTLFNFNIAILIFLILNLFINMNDLSVRKVLLSMIGWDSLGNSNWYMFSIFILYLIIIFVYKILKFKNIKSILTVFILTTIYIIFISFFKESYWYNTLLVFPFGMFYCHFKNKIDKIFFVNKNYILALVVNIILFVSLYYVNYYIVNISYFYNFLSIIFINILVLLMMKFNFSSKIYLFMGTNLFWIYILQRIPMIVFQNKFSNILYLLLCMVITWILTTIMSNFSKFIFSRKTK